jgi:DNA-binding MarR family transcriptional regulator
MTRYDFENSVGFVVNNTAKSFQRSLDLELRKNIGVTLSQWRVVGAIVLQPGLTQKELAAKTLLPDRTVRLALRHLLDKGYVKRRVSLRDTRQRIYDIPK